MVPRTIHAYRPDFLTLPYQPKQSPLVEVKGSKAKREGLYLGCARMRPRWRVPGRWWTRRPRPGTPTSPSRTRTPWGTTRGSARRPRWRPSPPRRRRSPPAARAAPPTGRPSRRSPLQHSSGQWQPRRRQQQWAAVAG
jgi:hypothetical protein